MITQQKQKVSDPFKCLMTSVMVGTAVEFQHKVINLMKEYRSKGIDCITLDVLDQMIFESSIETMSKEGLAGSFFNHIMKGDKNE